jgi:hypothetical protein
MCCSLSLFSNPWVNKIVINHVTYINILKLTQTVLHISIKNSITMTIYHRPYYKKFCGPDKVRIGNMLGFVDYKHTLLWILCGEPASCFEDFLNKSNQARFYASKSCCLEAILNPECNDKATVPYLRKITETDLFLFTQYFVKWQKWKMLIVSSDDFDVRLPFTVGMHYWLAYCVKMYYFHHRGILRHYITCFNGCVHTTWSAYSLVLVKFQRRNCSISLCVSLYT